MTMYSKANLEVHQVASSDEHDHAMNGVVLGEDGSTAACNRRVLLAVGPDGGRHHYPDVGPRAGPGRGLVVRPELLADVKKNLPKDKRAALQQTAMTEARDPRKVEFTTVSASGREKRVADYPKREPAMDWRAIVRNAREANEENARLAAAGEPMRVCVCAKDLLELLKVMVAACPDKGGEFPVYVEIGRGMVLRMPNKQTGQRAVGVAVPYRLQEWLEPDAWETGVYRDGKLEKDEDEKPSKRRVKRRKRKRR